MTSFSNVYRDRPFGLSQTQGKSIGRVIIATSIFLFTISVIAASTELYASFGYARWHAWKLAGILAGISAPLAFSGVFVLLPSEQSEREIALIGSTIAIVGVLLFWMNFPYQWMGDTPNHAFIVTSVYGTGLFTTFIAMFISVSNIHVSRPGNIVLERIQQTTDSLRGNNSAPEPEPEPTQPEPVATENGGVAVIGEPDNSDYAGVDDSEILGEDTPDSHADPYCGNCTHFSYTRVNGELKPYCGLHETQMDNLDACDQWTPDDEPL